MNQRGIIVGDRLISNVDTHADWCAAFGSCQQYDIVGASVIGRFHIYHQLPRDDAFLIRTAGEWIAVAIADGVGSHRSSRYGAAYAVGALCESLLRAVAAIPREAAHAVQPDESRSSAVASLPTGEGSFQGNFGFETVVSDSQREATHAAQPDESRSSAVAPLPTGEESSTSQSGSHPPGKEDSSNKPYVFPNFSSMTTDENTIACATLTWFQRSQLATPETSTEITDEMIRQAFRETHRGLEQFAQSRPIDIREISCTLLGLLFNTRTGLIAAGQIGDGLIVGLWRREDTQDTQILVEAPKPDAANEVYTVARKNWEKYLAVKVIPRQNADPEVEAIYLMTDGVADDCYPTEDTLKEWSRAVRHHLCDKELPHAAKLLVHWLATYEAKASWDDRTLVVILRRNENRNSHPHVPG